MTKEHCVLSSGQLTVAVAALGAEMQFLRTADGQDLLWHGDPEFWSGRAPILFPIVGRAVDDMVCSGGVDAEMKQHGFARRQDFVLDMVSETSCRHVLTPSEATRAVYPFSFQLSVTHALTANTLSVMAEVKNDDDRDLPFGFGFHPAFSWPLPGASAPHLVQLQDGGSPKRRPLRSDGLLEPALVDGPFDDGTLEITDDLFADGALVFPGANGSLRYGPVDGPHLEFTFENLPDLALWRPLGAPFLCVEPWHGTASHVGDGPDIASRPNSVLLAPGATARFGYTVAVQI